jgi:hypothetical protein
MKNVFLVSLLSVAVSIQHAPDLGESVSRRSMYNFRHRLSLPSVKQEWEQVAKRIVASHPLHFVKPDIQADVEAAEKKWRQNHPKRT